MLYRHTDDDDDDVYKFIFLPWKAFKTCYKTDAEVSSFMHGDV